MSQDNDKRELLKLKQGLIEESETIKEGYDVAMPDTASEKAKNWFWYHKTILVIGVLILILAAVIASLYFFKPAADIKMFSLSQYSSTTRRLLESNLPRYCEDYNSDGKSTVTLDQPPNEKVLVGMESTREVINGKSQIFIGTKNDLESLNSDYNAVYGGDLFADLSEFDTADGVVINFAATPMGKELKIYSQEIYMAVRKTDDEKEQQAREFIANIIANREVSGQ
ncbi:MAG: hypothetical protein J1E39_08890 [Eubacterium sp.]|nr:hypothetical protein [Eubacterium sp.]